MAFEDYTSEENITRSGVVQVTLKDITPNETSPVGGTVTVESITPISYDFEVPDSEEDPQNIGINGGSVDITFWDEVQLDDGTIGSLNERIEGLSGSQFPLEVEIELTRGGNDYSFIFFLEYADKDYDRMTRKVTLTLNAKLDFDNSQDMDSWANSFSDPRTFQGSDRWLVEDNLDAMMPRRLISSALQESFGGMSSIEVLSKHFDSFSPTDAEINFALFLIADGASPSTYGWAYGDSGDLDYLTIGQMLANLAGLEGAYYGNGFGSRFYVTRDYKDSGAHRAVDWNTVENIKIVNRRNMKFLKLVQSVAVVEQDGVNPSGSHSPYEDFNDDYKLIAEDSDSFISRGGRETLSIALEKYNLIPLYFDSSDAEFDFTSAGEYDTAFFDLAGDAIDSYAKALGASAPLRIEVTFWGVTSLFPWESMEFTNVPSSDDIFDGKDFRISNIEYDLETDKITAELYEI